MDKSKLAGQKRQGEITVFWFRRDLRLEDNRGLTEALRSGIPVLPLFIFDTNITEELPALDARITFIHEHLSRLDLQLKKQNSSLWVYQGEPQKLFQHLIGEQPVSAVYTNRDYEPYARERDEQIARMLGERGISFHSIRDQVIFHESDILKTDGNPYRVFTPYKRQWMKELHPESLKSFPAPTRGFLPGSRQLPSLEKLGFQPSDLKVRPYDTSSLNAYHELRDYPAADATTHLSPHLRFGTVSIRKIVRLALEKNETFLGELIWREFFMQVLYHYPHVVNNNFDRRYNGIRWRNDEKEFERWCRGKTGYPMVDAGMRELNHSGSMHNRVRMVCASFLCKHLLIDWRWGEAYFAEKLLDFELSSNNGNWQWAAGTGCDAAPYFRVFNPEAQLDRFDKKRAYIRKWIPEWGSPDYPPPLVEHAFARKRALEVYKKGLEDQIPE